MTMLRTAVAEHLARLQGFTAWTAAFAIVHRKFFDDRGPEDSAPILALGDCLHPLD